MKLRKTLYMAFFALAIASCSKDDGPTTPKNAAPVIAAQSFTAPENITDTQAMGTVKATDADADDTLTFSIATNSNALFEITGAGVLSLAPVKTLDFATKAQHVLSVSVSDGTASASANVTINVTEVVTTNQSPVIGAQGFEAAEDIADTVVIGTVTATDPEDDALIFLITVDESGLFEITQGGALSLAEGKTLDFATNEEHTLIVSVSDGNTASSAVITITVTEVIVANAPPSIAPQSFEAAEDIADTDIIGTVAATDPETDPLVFSIVEDASSLFEITEAGELSLADGQTLDFETSDKHTITVSVSDGNGNTVEAEVTINVTDVLDDLALDPASFVTTWQTTSDMESIDIGVDANLPYLYSIDWGDGTVENTNSSSNPEHTYATAGTYTVAIKGTFPAIRMAESNTPNSLMSIDQWGDIQWQTMESAFRNCANMQYQALDVPDLSQVTSMLQMFNNAVSFNGAIGNWDVSAVTDMGYMFSGADSFNQDIGNWTVGAVTEMSFMFAGADVFNQDLSNWDVSAVTNMSGMFSNANNFNQDIGGWTVSAVTNMNHMFSGADNFNQDIGSWNVSNVIGLYSMFRNADSFNQNLGGWDLRNGVDMNYMLENSGLSTTNYDGTLIGWATNGNTPDNISLGATNLTFCAVNQRSFLINVKIGPLPVTQLIPIAPN